MVPAGSKAKRFSSVNHTTKTIQFNHIELGNSVIFISYIAWLFLIFVPKNLVWNKMVLSASKSLNVLELEKSEL